MILTQERLKHLLSYDPETGIWIWLNPPNHNTRLKGKLAGNRASDGYLKIRINGQIYISSRLACLYMTGRFPVNEMDHKNRDRGNDRWANLREATSSENKYNREGYDSRGVYRTGHRWWAMVGRNNYLGTFDTLEEAIIARDAEAQRLGGAFAVLHTQSQGVSS